MSKHNGPRFLAIDAILARDDLIQEEKEERVERLNKKFKELYKKLNGRKSR